MSSISSRVLLLLGACVTVLIPVPAVAQTTALVLQSEPGDGVGGGITQTWAAPAAAFTVTRNHRNGISVTVDGVFPLSSRLEFSLPGGQQITPGHYTGATRYPFTPFVGMAVSGPGSACNELTGRYLVREVEYGIAGEVLRFAVDVEQHCEDLTPALFAALRFNSTIGTDIFPGSANRYGLAMTGSDAGLVTGGGLACGAGEVACSTVFTSATHVTIVATPLDGYVFDGWSGGCSGGPTTVVNVNTVRECAAAFTPAIPSHPRTRLTFSSAPGESIGQGKAQVYSFVNSRWSVTSASAGNDLTFTVEGMGPTRDVAWYLDLRAPAGGILQPGYYPGASEAAFRTTTPGLSFHGDGRACGTIAGEFTVHQYVRNPATGEVIAFAADFTQRCGLLTSPALTGRIEYWATYQIPTACQTADPFASLGGGRCHDGGWLPPGMPIPGPPVPPPTTPPPPITPPAGCSTLDPFSVLGGGTCYNGGWLPPGMPVPSGGTPAPPPPTPTPPPAGGGCTTSDPFTVLGGGMCYNGGWLPPGMPIPGGGRVP